MVVILYFGEIQTSLSLDSGKRYLSLRIIEKVADTCFTTEARL